MTFDHIAVAFIHPHKVDSLFQTALWRTVAAHPGIQVIDMGSGPMIAPARNEIVRTFLSHDDWDWLWMIDADMTFPPETLDRLLEAADKTTTPILGGLCFIVGRAGKIEPTLRVTDADEGGLKVVWDYPENAVVSVDATGGACLLVHRSVFERLAETYNDNPYPFFADSAHGQIQWGEDVTFCIRARQHGFPVKVHTGIEIGHVKPYVYGSYDYKLYRQRVAEIGEDAYANEYLTRQGVTAADPATPVSQNRAVRRRLARAR